MTGVMQVSLDRDGLWVPAMWAQLVSRSADIRVRGQQRWLVYPTGWQGQQA